MIYHQNGANNRCSTIQMNKNFVSMFNELSRKVTPNLEFKILISCNFLFCFYWVMFLKAGFELIN